MAGFIQSLTLEAGEEMRGVYHRHGMTLFMRLVPYAVILIVLFLFLFPLFTLGWKGVILFSVLFLACLLLSIRSIISWLGSMTVLTNVRLLLVERSGFFKTQVSEMKLDQIFKVSYEMKGVRQALGRYGTVILVVMFTGDNMHIKDIPNPQEALNQISAAVSEVKKSEQGKSDTSMAVPTHQTHGRPTFHAQKTSDPANWR
ncbi:hypothetical protein HY623_01255 [Candidatus Uhrbacteria bacterium]|nr:hypothetical protein [Candidatus Uhrbacteria bacterium]